MKVFIDGKYCEEQDAKVSVFDHGLLYGDGVFEGIRPDTYPYRNFLSRRLQTDSPLGVPYRADRAAKRRRVFGRR